MPPINAVKSCGIENIFDITTACRSGRFNNSGTAIRAIPIYKIKNFATAAETKATI